MNSIGQKVTGTDVHAAWQTILRDNFRHPQNRAAVQGMTYLGSSRNPLCGDRIEVGVNVEHGQITNVRFTGYACSVAVASASLMTQSMQGSATDPAKDLATSVQTWFSNDSDSSPLPQILQPLQLLRCQATRKRCAMLAWQALGEALAKVSDRPEGLPPS